jgi:hypothetical protein
MISLTAIGLALTLMLGQSVSSFFPEVSLSIGLTGAALYWVAIASSRGPHPYRFDRSDGRFAFVTWSTCVFLILHACISNLITGGVDFNRLLFSTVILMVLLTGANSAGKLMLRVPPRLLARTASILFWVLTMMGLWGAAGLPGLGSGYFGKPIVVFEEPSHFGLAYLPILLFNMSLSRRPRQMLLLVIALMVAVLLQSLSTVAGIAITASLLLRSSLLLVFMIPVVAVGAVLDLAYYSDRLNFSGDSSNLSTLVFLQGWENGITNFMETRGLGVGFQQFGIAGSTGEITDKIVRMLQGSTINLMDGSTVGSKLLGEFGILGIGIMLAFVVIAAYSVRFIRRQQRLPPLQRDIRGLFFRSMATTYVLEIFIRGTGYFDAGTFLAIVGLIGLARGSSSSENQPVPANPVQKAAVAPP